MGQKAPMAHAKVAPFLMGVGVVAGGYFHMRTQIEEARAHSARQIESILAADGRPMPEAAPPPSRPDLRAIGTTAADAVTGMVAQATGSPVETIFPTAPSLPTMDSFVAKWNGGVNTAHQCAFFCPPLRAPCI